MKNEVKKEIMKRAIVATIIAVAVCAFASDEIMRFDEYGRPSEMKGLTKIYLETNGDAEAREALITTIEKRVPTKLQWLGKADDAEMGLIWRSQLREDNVRESTITAVHFFDTSKIRLLWSSTDKKGHRWSRSELRELAIRFADAYNDAQRAR